jgi:hypothetical protein
MSLASWFSSIPGDELTPEQREQIARLQELQEAVPAYSSIYEVVAVHGFSEALEILSRIAERLAEDTDCKRCAERASMISHELSKLADFAGIACENFDAPEDK